MCMLFVSESLQHLSRELLESFPERELRTLGPSLLGPGWRARSQGVAGSKIPHASEEGFLFLHKLPVLTFNESARRSLSAD